MPGLSETLRQLKEEKEDAVRRLEESQRREAEMKEEIKKLQARNASIDEKRNSSQLKRLQDAREQTAKAESKFAELQKKRDKERQMYLTNLKKLAAKRREASSTALVPTAPLTTRSGQKGFLNNMKWVMGLALKNPGVAFTALTASLAALGMTVMQQQEQINQHRQDMIRLQNQLYGELNRTNYYRRGMKMIQRAGLQQGTGNNPLSRAMTKKALDEQKRNIRQQQKALGPPPDKR